MIEEKIQLQPAGTCFQTAFHHQLRAATRREHEMVDQRFGTFDLLDPREYIMFLTAHALVLPAFERAVAAEALLPGWRGRGDALLRDLKDLSVTAPTPEPLPLMTDPAERWGTLYVIEGSRLGGAVVARRVGSGLPTTYLSSAHAPGEWRAFLAALDRATVDEAWRKTAIQAAKSTFEAYANAAREAQHG